VEDPGCGVLAALASEWLWRTLLDGKEMASSALVVVVMLLAACLVCSAAVKYHGEEGLGEHLERERGLCPVDVIAMREEAREAFYYAYDNYMLHAYPADELMPLSCKGRYRDPSNPRGHMDQVLGNYTLTLIDSLDTLAVLGDYVGFETGVQLVKRDVSFDRDVTVNLFEVTIRVLGGLLSSHLLAEKLQEECLAVTGADWDRSHLGDLLLYREELLEQLDSFYGIEEHRSLPAHDIFLRLREQRRACVLQDYKGELLDLAMDLGIRLLPAFQTNTGIPFSTVNLKFGIGLVESDPRTCLAGAGTLLLEFGTLSRLTGYTIFESSAAKAMKALLNRKSASDMLPGLIDVNSGSWLEQKASIGAGSDSFYEYLFKAYILLGDPALYGEFASVYTAIQSSMQADHHYYGVDYRTGKSRQKHIDSLQAFWPALQVIAGDVSNAIENHARYLDIWRRVGFLPEVYFPMQQAFDKRNGEYPLRPEFVESTLFLSGSTGRSFYRRVGAEVLTSLQTSTRTSCGFASINVVKGRLGDRMDSYFLAETLKYLYLLFDDINWIDRGNYVFTTEGHPLPVGVVKDPNDVLAQKICVRVPDALHNRITELEDIFYGHVAEEVEERAAAMPTVDMPLEEETEIRQEGVDISASLITDYARVLVYKSQEDSKEDDVSEPPVPFLSLVASMGQFGPGPARAGTSPRQQFVVTDPPTACEPLGNGVAGKVAVVRRGGCMFIEKAMHVQSAGGTGMVVVDDDKTQHFAFYMTMEGDGMNDDEIKIPCVLLHMAAGEHLVDAAATGANLLVLEAGDTPLVLVDTDLDSLTAKQRNDLREQVSEALARFGATNPLREERPVHGDPLAKVDVSSGDVAHPIAGEEAHCEPDKQP